MTSCSLVIQNRVEQISVVTEAFRTFANQNSLSADSIYDGELAIEEIAANIIFYAYPSDGDHQIHFTFGIQDRELIISIEDDGVAFNPMNVPPPDLSTPLEDRKVGGLGVHLVRTVMDEIAYERKGQRNRLLLKKKL
jgi:anti-sigma regulatory factor (Ser/Thr protein kinase)